MSVISRLNKSTLSATQKRQVKKALASKSTIKYVTADDTVANASVAHVPIDNLSIPVEKNKVYKFEVWTHFTNAGGAGGAQISFTGSAAANFINGQWFADSSVAAAATTSVAIAAITDESQAAEGVAAVVWIRGTGVYSPSDDGVFKVAGAQSTSNASDTICKKGSWFSLEEIV